MTVQDLLTSALTDLGVIQAGETPTAADSEIAFARFNDWLNGNKLLAGLIFQTVRTTWALTGAASYTVGVGGTLSIQRPISPSDITALTFYDTTVSPILEMALVLFTDDQYFAIPQKGLTSVYPVGFHYEATYGATGFGTLAPWPIPTSSTLRGVVYAKTSLDEFTATSDTVSVPPGYRRFFRTNLAIELASAFGVPVPPQVEQIARMSMHDVKTANLRMTDLDIDSDLLLPLYDVFSDTNS